MPMLGDKISHPRFPALAEQNETPDVGGVWRFGAYRIGTEPANVRGTVMSADLEYDYDLLALNPT